MNQTSLDENAEVLSSETVFLRMGPRVSPGRTFSKPNAPIPKRHLVFSRCDRAVLRRCSKAFFTFHPTQRSLFVHVGKIDSVQICSHFLKIEATWHYSRTLPKCAPCHSPARQLSMPPELTTCRRIPRTPWKFCVRSRYTNRSTRSIRSTYDSVGCCAPPANAHHRQAWLWPFCIETFCHMVACKFTGDNSGNGTPTHVKLVRRLFFQARLRCLEFFFFSKVLCSRRVECQKQELEWSLDWSCAKLDGRTSPDHL